MNTSKNYCKSYWPLNILLCVPLTHHCTGKAQEYIPKACFFPKHCSLEYNQCIRTLRCYFLVASFLNN